MQFTSFMHKVVLIASAALALTLPVVGQVPTDSMSVTDLLHTYYGTTKTGRQGTHASSPLHSFAPDYNNVTEAGKTFVVLIPGIYAQFANTPAKIIPTEIENGHVINGVDFSSAPNTTGESMQLTPGQTVYITRAEAKRNTIFFELITTQLSVQHTALGDGPATRYRADINIHVNNLSTAKPAEIKQLIDAVLADAATTNPAAVTATNNSQTKTVDLGMTADQVKQSLGNPDKVMNLGPKTIFVYKDVKVIFTNSVVADVQ